MDLSDLILGEQTGRFREPAPAVAGVIATTLASEDDELFVVIPEYDPNVRFGPCPFTGPLPTRGDDCLVIFDDERQPWVVVPGAFESGGGPDPEPGTGDLTYLHVQGVASDTWVIAHDLNKYPSVSLLDSGHEEIEGSVDHLDQNNAVVTFAGPVSGSATLN
jgi:hypothetical protein